jgi:hypothetical protein
MRASNFSIQEKDSEKSIMSNQRFIESQAMKSSNGPLMGVALVNAMRDHIKGTPDRADLIEAAKAKLQNGVHPATGDEIAEAFLSDLS